MTENQKSLRELLFCIKVNNEMAREAHEAKNEKDAQKYHNICKNCLVEVIEGPYGNVSKVLKKMYDGGTGIGCDECIDTYRYAQALFEKNKKGIDKIERKYGIQPEDDTLVML